MKPAWTESGDSAMVLEERSDKDARDSCPACAKPQAYYMQLNFVR